MLKTYKLSFAQYSLRFILIFSVWCGGSLVAEPTPPPKQPIIIGAALHLTGEYASAGVAFQQGIEIALDEINGSGGILGHPVKLLVEDTAYDMIRVQSIVRKFSSLDTVNAILISNYTEVMRVGKWLERSKVPTLTIWDSSPEIEQLGDYIFGMGVWSPSSAEITARYSHEVLKARTAVIVSTEGEWSLKVAGYFSEKFRERGGTILRSVSVLPTDTDFRTLFASLRSLKPDVIYAPISDNIAPFFSQLAESQIKSTILTSDVLSEDLVNILGSKVEGVLQSQAADPRGKELQNLMQSYKLRFSKECTQSLFVALGYDSLMVLREAARQSGSIDRESLKNGMYQIKNFSGASGLINFSAEGSSRVGEQLYKIANKKSVPVE